MKVSLIYPKRWVAILCILASAVTTVDGQKKYEMVIEKTDDTNTVIKTEDLVVAYFREQAVDTLESYLTCPDDRHPHLIDLGLPSGTKWACCDVGATKPEEFGSLYAWGEVDEKDNYSWSTYEHCDGDEDSCHDIGMDIAGTCYDVAHVRWGGTWVMPSLEQVRELDTIKNITYEVTTLHGVKVVKLTGNNGGSIFIPERMAGLSNYWSSTRHQDNGSLAFYLKFYGYSRFSSNFVPCYFGNCVRPVSR